MSKLAIDQKRGLSRVDAAGYVGVGVSLFDMMVADGVMPAPWKYRGRLIWDKTRVDQALDGLSTEVEPPVAPTDDGWGVKR